ncbi:MAG: arginine repressor [Blastocatellia bacterium]|nr:arginine repressor [Blastocatellia bacterium]
MKKLQDKAERQKTILKLIKEAALATQGDLRDALKTYGIECDQATISRDIKELSLVRVTDGDGHYRYAMLEEAHASPLRAKRLDVLRRFLQGVEWSGNMLVVRTDTANAHPVAEALDHLGFEGLLGTVAGDNTIIAVVKENFSAKDVALAILKEAGKEQ